MRIAIGIFFLLFGIGIAYSLFRLSMVINRVNDMLDNVNKEIVPLLTRVEATIDGVNSELDGVDQITESVATMVKVAEQTTVAVQSAVSKPVKLLAGVSAGIKRGFRSFFSDHDKGE